MMELSTRLQKIASFVTPGGRVADIGTDHGYLPIYLVEQGVIDGGLAMDIRKGPLDRASEHICEAGLENQLETRLSNGLEKLEPGEADTVVIAGMGGPLILDILEAGGHVRTTVKEFILSPQSDWRGFRLGMEKLGLVICREEMVYEDGKYYLIVRAVNQACLRENGDTESMGREELAGHSESMGNGAHEPNVQDGELAMRFGTLLLAEKSPVLREYLCWQEGILTGILHRLRENSTSDGGKRRAEVENDLGYVRKALDMMTLAG